MPIETLLKILKANFKVSFDLIPISHELILNAQIKDYNQLLNAILDSKSFDYLSKVRDGIKKTNNTQIECLKCDLSFTSEFETLYNKTCNIFDEMHWDISTSNRIAPNYEIGKIFDINEMTILRRVGTNTKILNFIIYNKPLFKELLFKSMVGENNKTKNDILFENKKDINVDITKIIGFNNR